jgi:hypothetical protein
LTPQVFVEQYRQEAARNASGMARATQMFVVSPLGVKRWHEHKAAGLIEAFSQFRRAASEGATTNMV